MSEPQFGLFVEGVDYYYDQDGLMVLTALFLKRRGHCCRNGCRHCPYGYGPEGKMRDQQDKQGREDICRAQKNSDPV